jgi:hypothetical protein
LVHTSRRSGALNVRIDETARHILGHLQIRNSYVNRSVIGAVVGVQPLGGEGLSGTGPKAGAASRPSAPCRSTLPPPAAMTVSGHCSSRSGPPLNYRLFSIEVEHPERAR